MVQRKEKYVNLVVCLADIVSLFISYLMGSYLGLRFVGKLWSYTHRNLIINLGFLLVTFMLIFFIFSLNAYFLQRSAIEELLNVIKYNIVLAVLLTFVLYLTKTSAQFSRSVFAVTLILNVLIGYGIRMWVKQYLRKYYAKHSNCVMLITTHDRAEKVVSHFNNSGNWENKITYIALVDDNKQGEKICGVPVVASYEDMFDYAKQAHVDEVFFHISYRTGHSLHPYIEQFEKMGVTVHVIANLIDGFEEFNQKVEMVGGYPVISFTTASFDSEKMIVKRLIDIIGGLVGCVVAAILLLIFGPLIKLESPGPVLFKQQRVGRNGKIFSIYKMRSMYMDAEERKKELMAQNEMKGLMFKMTDDPRITKIGKFIRSTSIDEFPQFFNVLKGDMSLVGTRPPTVDEFNQYEIYHKRRLMMKPGITGMWQVSGRSDIEDFEEVVRLDLSYIDNWSLALDFKILFKTVTVVFGKVGSR